MAFVLALAACASSLAQDVPEDFDSDNCTVRTFVDDFTDLLDSTMLACFVLGEEYPSGFRFDHFYEDGMYADQGVLQFTVFDFDHRGDAGDEVDVQVRVGTEDALDLLAYWEDGAANGATTILKVSQAESLLDALKVFQEIIYRVDYGHTRRVEVEGASLRSSGGRVLPADQRT